MKNLVVLVLCTVLVSSTVECFKIRQNSKTISEPKFCRDLECPTYNTTGSGKGFEVRVYASAAWVSTTVMSMDYDSATSEGFERLFKYISGENVKKTKIAMTAPVINRVIPGQGPACDTNFTISFFVPFEYQSNPVPPSNPDVFISILPQQKVLVGEFSGFARGSDYVKQAAELRDAVASSSYKYNTGYYYTAGYDSPFQIFNRHNEVWFVVEKE